MKNVKKLSLLSKQLIVIGSIIATFFVVTFTLYLLEENGVINLTGAPDESTSQSGSSNNATNSSDNKGNEAQSGSSANKTNGTAVEKKEHQSYFTFLGKLLGIIPKDTKKADDGPQYDEDGDRLGIGGRPYIYEEIPQEKVKTVEVQNIDPATGKKRNFSFYMDSQANSLILSGYENLSFDKELLSYLYVNTCNTLSMAKVSNPSEDLTQYGLAGGVSDTWFEVTTTDDTKKRVYIGDKFPTGGGYYCKSVDKPHIYVIDTMVENCVMVAPETYIVPLLCKPLSQQEMYNVDNLTIEKDGERIITLNSKATSAEGENKGLAVSHIMTYPGGYTVAQTVVDNIIRKLADFRGGSVELVNIADVSAELDALGIEYDAKTIEVISYPEGPVYVPDIPYIKQNGEKVGFDDVSGDTGSTDASDVAAADNAEVPAEQEVVTESEAPAEQSAPANTEVPAEQEAPTSTADAEAPEGMRLLREDDDIIALLWADRFEKYGFLTPSRRISYTINGKEYSVIFGKKTADESAYYAMNEDSTMVCIVPCADVPFLEYELIDFVDKCIFQMDINNVESLEVKAGENYEKFLLTGEKTELKVTRETNGVVVDTKTFRQFYIDLLRVSMVDYADGTNTENEILSYKFTTRDGYVYDYKFYDLSTTKVYYTLNGIGEFYINRDDINKVINDFGMVLAGETFISDAIA